MFKVNQDYLKLPGSYLFSTVARKQREYQAAHPEAEIIFYHCKESKRIFCSKPGETDHPSWYR